MIPMHLDVAFVCVVSLHPFKTALMWYPDWLRTDSQGGRGGLAKHGWDADP
jgi:hypothetical protein